MVRKTFKDTTANIDKFFTGAGGQEPPNTQRTYETHNTQKPQATYRINLKLNKSHEEYLKAISWKQGKSITQYINELIEADKLKQGEAKILKLYKDTQNA